jgi:Tol biopolymer transport system component
MSANGRLIAFLSCAQTFRKDGSGGIYVHNRTSHKTELVSVNSNEKPGNNFSSLPGISPNGRFVAFASASTNLVGNDKNGLTRDIFLRDRQKGTTILISKGMGGAGANDESRGPVAVSDNGRFVVFASSADNLVPNDDNNFIDVFYRDTVKGKTTRISVSDEGVEGNSHSLNPAMSRDGSRMVFDSGSTTFVEGDGNGPDIFMYDREEKSLTGVSHGMQAFYGAHMGQVPSISYSGNRVAYNGFVEADGSGSQGNAWLANLGSGTYTQMSVTPEGATPDAGSGPATISGNGSKVAFVSSATDIISNDSNEEPDVFLATLGSGGSVSIVRVSVNSAGKAGKAASSAYGHVVDTSDSGNSVAFDSFAENLVGNDDNEKVDVFVHIR